MKADLELAIPQAAKRIKVIPEGRDDGETLKQAQALLDGASRICFLGFGFDAINIRRLGAPGVFLNGAHKPKRVAATALGLTRAEVARAATRLFGDRNTDAIVANFHNLNCISLLRETLILD